MTRTFRFVFYPKATSTRAIVGYVTADSLAAAVQVMRRSYPACQVSGVSEVTKG